MKRLTWKRSVDGYTDVGLRKGVTAYEAICKLADYEEAEAEAAVDAVGLVHGRWIPVSEGLPVLHEDDYKEPDGSRVQFEVSDDQWVVTASGYQTKARYETGVVFQGWVGEHGETVRNVTHWMSLPEPPKEDK